MAFLEGLLQEDDFIHQTLGHFNSKYRALMKHAKHIASTSKNHHLQEAIKIERARSRQQIVTDKPATDPISIIRDEMLKSGLESDADLLRFGNLSLLLYDFYTAIGCYSSVVTPHSELPPGQQYLIALVLIHFQSWPTVASLLEPIAQHLVPPYNCDAYFRLGICYKRMGLLEQARRAFQAALLHPPTWIPQTDIIVELSHLDFLKGDISGALTLLDGVSVFTPAVLQQQAFLCLCSDNVGKMESGVIFLTESKATEFSADLLYLRARLLYKLGKLHDAFEVLNSALLLNDKSPLIWCALGNIYVRHSQLQEAVGCYFRAIGCDDSMMEAWLNFAACLEIDPVIGEANKQLLAKLHDSPVKPDLTRRRSDVRNLNPTIPTIVEPNDRDRVPSAAALIDELIMNEVPVFVDGMLDDLNMLVANRDVQIGIPVGTEDASRESAEDGTGADSSVASESDSESSELQGEGEGAAETSRAEEDDEESE
jgi:tetratricopeptide (TPR) repeat protein